MDEEVAENFLHQGMTKNHEPYILQFFIKIMELANIEDVH